MRATATNVTGLVIPDAGHWLMEEQPKATIAAVRTFLDTP
jgi:pimeloyl-ACP methyl ester carboxylesterase